MRTTCEWFGLSVFFFMMCCTVIVSGTGGDRKELPSVQSSPLVQSPSVQFVGRYAVNRDRMKAVIVVDRGATVEVWSDGQLQSEWEPKDTVAWRVLQSVLVEDSLYR